MIYDKDNKAHDHHLLSFVHLCRYGVKMCYMTKISLLCINVAVSGVLFVFCGDFRTF